MSVREAFVSRAEMTGLWPEQVEQPNWDRERVRGWCPSKFLLRSIRDYQRYARWNPLKKLAVLRHRFWSVVCGADIPINTRIGGGLVLHHPIGVVIHPSARIGTNCMLQSGVVLGWEAGGTPTIGDGVEIGAGAKIIGAVTIGHGARIGANAVVLSDVPAGATAVGAPARVLARPAREAAYWQARQMSAATISS